MAKYSADGDMIKGSKERDRNHMELMKQILDGGCGAAPPLHRVLFASRSFIESAGWCGGRRETAVGA